MAYFIFLVYFKCCLFVLLFDNVSMHGYMIDPPARSSVWRVDSRFPAFYNDMEMFCGGFYTQWSVNNGRCGICGEDYSQPKKFEKNGSYYVGTSVRQYFKGDLINISVVLTANHLGWFEFKICNTDGFETDATQDCLDKILLADLNGTTRFNINQNLKFFKTQLELPCNLVCKKCVIQWKYHTGNRWGKDPLTGNRCLGCQPEQEEFYGCADITIRDPSVKPLLNSIEEIILPKTVEIEPDFSLCLNGDGYYSDYKTNCTSYYLCSLSNSTNQIVKKYWCEEGLIFDVKTKNCNWPEKTTCREEISN